MTVQAGDVIADIETDKATMEFEAVDEGSIGKILVPEGTEHIPVNQPIALLIAEGRGRPLPMGGKVAFSAARHREGVRNQPKGGSRIIPSPQPSPHRERGFGLKWDGANKWSREAYPRETCLCLAAGTAARTRTRHRSSARSMARARTAASSNGYRARFA